MGATLQRMPHHGATQPQIDALSKWLRQRPNVASVEAAERFETGSLLLRADDDRGFPSRQPGGLVNRAPGLPRSLLIFWTCWRRAVTGRSCNGRGCNPCDCSTRFSNRRAAWSAAPLVAGSTGVALSAVLRRCSCQTPSTAVLSPDSPRNRPAKERRRRTARCRRISRPLPASPRIRRSDDHLGRGGRHRPSRLLPVGNPRTAPTGALR